MASPIGEERWIDFVQAQSREAADLESRANVVESFRSAVQAEPGSLKLWIAYCEYFWSLYTACQPGNDTGWLAEAQVLGREVFTLDIALQLWQEGYEAVQYRLSDSHTLWNRWISLEMELLSRTKTEAGVRRITQLFKYRLTVPHASWDDTSNLFSSFLSEYNNQAYETEMKQVTKNATNAKRLYDLRDPYELKLCAASDATKSLIIMKDYLEWELRQPKNRKDALINFQICLGLFSRALTGILSFDKDTWHSYIALISTSHSDFGAKRSKLAAEVIPNMLDVLQRAVRHIPWSGPIWARYILVAEEAGLTFTDIERIKHAATSSPELERDGMTDVLDMYSAWCGYLKRTAMNPNATEEAVDLAEVGLPAALEDVRHWGKRRYGDEYRGDPNFRLESILIQFLTEKKDDVEGARAIWEQLSTNDLYASTCDFWLHWYLWEMIVFAAAKNRPGSPTLSSVQGLRVPTLATRVFVRAMKTIRMDWPERIMDVYMQHCNDYELPPTLREAQDQVFKTRKAVAKRREREKKIAEEQAVLAAQAHIAMADAAEVKDSPGRKRKREASPENFDSPSKRPKSEQSTSEPSRDRENTSVFVTNLPSNVTQTRIRQFFRGYGHINNLSVQRKEGQSAVVFIEFRSREDVQTALLRSGKHLGDEIVHVTAAANCTLWVTNYPPDADENFIRDLFKDCGEGDGKGVFSVRYPSLKYNTKRRFCYVTFRDSAAAAAAVKLDGMALEGDKYTLQAKLSNPAVRAPRRGPLEEQRELHVLNLPASVTEQDLEKTFKQAGKVQNVRILRSETGKPVGTAFVVMQTREEAQKAVEDLDQRTYGKHIIKVEMAKPISKKKSTTTDAPGEFSGTASPSGSATGQVPEGPTPTDTAFRSIAIIGVPDTMNDARLRDVLRHVPTIRKMVLHPQHGGAVLEFEDAVSLGKAVLMMDGMQVADGKKLRTIPVKDLFRNQAEERRDRIDQPKKALAGLMPLPPPVHRPAFGRGKPKRAPGLLAGIPKPSSNGALDPGSTCTDAGGAKSNADFKKMFLAGKSAPEEKQGR